MRVAGVLFGGEAATAIRSTLEAWRADETAVVVLACEEAQLARRALVAIASLSGAQSALVYGLSQDARAFVSDINGDKRVQLHCEDGVNVRPFKIGDDEIEDDMLRLCVRESTCDEVVMSSCELYACMLDPHMRAASTSSKVLKDKVAPTSQRFTVHSLPPKPPRRIVWAWWWPEDETNEQLAKKEVAAAFCASKIHVVRTTTKQWPQTADPDVVEVAQQFPDSMKSLVVRALTDPDALSAYKRLRQVRCVPLSRITWSAVASALRPEDDCILLFCDVGSPNTLEFLRRVVQKVPTGGLVKRIRVYEFREAVSLEPRGRFDTPEFLDGAQWTVVFAPAFIAASDVDVLKRMLQLANVVVRRIIGLTFTRDGTSPSPGAEWGGTPELAHTRARLQRILDDVAKEV